MASFPTASFLSQHLDNSFSLKQHLQEFLHLSPEHLEKELSAKCEQMKDLGHKDFDWQQATDFYKEKVGQLYLFELGAWHLASHEYIADTLRLISDNVQGRVLDFGGGIGTHTIGAALCPNVEQVIYCDINPINRNFVQYRGEKLGINHKIIYCAEMPESETFDTIICFDVLEHLPDPVQQLLKFHKALKSNGKMIVNWYFSKGFNQEYPFHLDDPKVIDNFFRTLQSQFLEVFHPYHITTRCYCKYH